MFTEVQIENYKSIQSLKINLGRVNVFIGENGCGKTNILEAIALAGAAAGNKLDNEFLAPRGIRVTEPEFMRSAFNKDNVIKEISICLKLSKIGYGETTSNFVIQNDNKPYSSWENLYKLGQLGINLDSIDSLEELKNLLFNQEVIDFIVEQTNNKLKQKKNNFIDVSNLMVEVANEVSDDAAELILYLKKEILGIRHFLIYSPENSSLRVFDEEGQIQPLGIKGQGLLKLLKILNNDSNKINEIKQRLDLIDWFDDFTLSIDSDLERNVQIKDRYLDKELPYFNQRSSNEGFLFLMFYFALFVSDDTPKFFAIDNIENALNPKLCTRLIQELVELAKKYDKQVIFTTHNPAILDGLDLHDDEQRLFTIYRNIYGHTKAERIFAPQPLEDEDPVPLSEAFMNGYIGGLPDNF